MKRLLTSCFGLGHLPVAPGTWGSLPPAAVFALMLYFNVGGITISVVMAALALMGSFVCVIFSGASIAATGKKDPGEVVADEVAGQSLTFVPIPFILTDSPSVALICAVTAAGFLLFRFFDILKPWPIRKLEKLPSGWGILVDDLLAGVYATVILIVTLKLWQCYIIT